MRKVIYAVILLSLFFVPLERVEIGELLPVRAVAVYASNGMIFVEIDTGEKGSGIDVTQALDQLKRNTPAIIYLKTAEYLLVTEATENMVPVLRGFMRNNVKIYNCDAEGRVKEVAEYLDVHGELTKMHSLWTR